ncbi:DoxX-like family protein [Aneurinibacillus sp. REN35]|uniref:DoxX-like family protein n=1 Tax=Aneurinibacillus sp. REN35 TaxID=3237286 RepID=UPI003529CBBD
MSKRRPVYVEAAIQTDVNTLWEYTQNPHKHERWDLRFSQITYLPKEEETKPQRFLYRTHIGFGLSIIGEGESIGSHTNEAGERTSSLRFWTGHPLSLIREGSGYWKYSPHESGVRFVTQYDYRTRFGWCGRWLDAVAFRPLIGWATAWSFDCLRLWLEKGIAPEISFSRSAVQWISIWTLALVWIYQGLVPKVIYRDAGELALLHGLGISPDSVGPIVLIGAGILEIVFGISTLLFWRQRVWFLLTIILLLGLGTGAFLGDAAVFTAPFNPVSLNVLMMSLSLIALINRHHLPDAKRCIRERKRVG